MSRAPLATPDGDEQLRRVVKNNAQQLRQLNRQLRSLRQECQRAQNKPPAEGAEKKPMFWLMLSDGLRNLSLLLILFLDSELPDVVFEHAWEHLQKLLSSLSHL